MAIISNIIRIIGKPIILKLGKGLKSTKKIWCPGEEMDISLDDSVVGKDNVTGPISSRINSLARWKDAIGKTLTDSKTIQDDNGTTETTSTVDGELKQLIDNLSRNDSAAVVQHLRSLVKTMIRQEIKDKQIWDAYINTTSKSYVVRGQNLEDGTPGKDFLEITRRGAVKNLNQPQGLIVLETTTGRVIGQNNWYRLGNKETWTAIFDNYKIFTSLGGSTANPLKAVINEKGTFQFKVGMLLRSPGRATSLQFRILTKGREYFSFGSIPQGLTDGYLSDNIGVIADDNDELYFEIWGGISGPAIEVSVDGEKWPILYTGIFYYLLG